ncbi:hypothetical protein [Paenibacillus sp. MDMC362]|uniref:hypothetical protein n=1 Tax=Paenibacillus sp. MDMC362 TaxID=2977365 RepID=UPI000DC2EC6C|nr:hypothetical protein [Paenibacillus sp. MDMC362]RAR44145.1 hypothetical protein DP091_09795 [Paenibacillus sp. MDMC362]
MDAEKVYVFNGMRFMDYIKPDQFVDRLHKELDIEVQDLLPKGFSEIYETLNSQHRSKKKKFDKIFFEEIFYGRLTHAYIHKISTKVAPSKELFLKRVERVLERFQSTAVVALRPYMTTEGFYLMDVLNVTKTGATFLAGFDFTENDVTGTIETARFLAGSNVIRRNTQNEDIPEYLLAGVEIDFKKRHVLVMHKHTVNVQEEEDSEKVHTSSRFYNFIMDKIVNELGIELQTLTLKDQEGMSQMCKFLVNGLVSDIREELNQKTKMEINHFGNSSMKLLRQLYPEGNPITSLQQEEFEAKVSALLLGITILSQYDPEALKVKAKTVGLPGYPVRIFYKNANANTSSTGTKRVENSIVTAETLYSLLTDFENTKYLRSWSMAWFTDVNPSNAQDLDVIQTVIESTKNCFRVNFKARRNLGKELIHNVIDGLNAYRNY